MKNMQEWYNRKGIVVLTNIVIWMIVLALPRLLDFHGNQHQISDEMQHRFSCLDFSTNFLWVGPFYLNAYWLTPRLFYNRRYVSYIASLILLLGVILLLHALLFIRVFGIPYFSIVGATFHLLPAFLLTVAISITLRVVRDRMRADKLNQLKQEENLKTELSFLRSQINPHFIFNILNNLVALERMKSAELGPTILKLSSLMQYMLYDTDEDNVELELEVEYLQSYIDLQRQRFGEKVNIRGVLEVPEQMYHIEPMLLIPFVENAFKHGVGLIDHPEINIQLYIQQGVLYFSVKNKYNPGYEEVKDRTSGIGLTNVKRRLNLLYGSQHSLLINKDDHWFTVSLRLNLH